MAHFEFHSDILTWIQYFQIQNQTKNLVHLVHILLFFFVQYCIHFLSIIQYFTNLVYMFVSYVYDLLASISMASSSCVWSSCEVLSENALYSAR